MSKHGQLYNEWLTHNTMDRYMSDHKDRMENDKGVEEVNYETRDYDGIRWIRYDHYEHALLHQLQKARQDWLREEIVRLEEEKLEAELHYDMRGMTETKAYCSALQTIIDRYHSELDQDSNNTN